MQFAKRLAEPVSITSTSGIFPAGNVTANTGIVPGNLQPMTAARSSFDIKSSTGSTMMFAPTAQSAPGLTFLPLHQFPLRPPPQQQSQTAQSIDQATTVSFSPDGLVRLSTLQPQLVRYDPSCC